MRRQSHGSATRTNIPVITIRGAAYARGVQYGRAVAKNLAAFYDWFVRKEPREVMTSDYTAVLENMEETVARHFPQFLDEIKGWSDGSRLPYDKCRLMAFHNGVRYVLNPGCSNVVVTGGPDGPWLAKNEDLFEDERSWQVLKIAYCDDARSYLGGFYVGLPECGAGINAAGLAVGGSSLPAQPPDQPRGLPNLSYYLLCTQDTVADCRRVVREQGFLGKGIHLALLDATGDAAAIEAGGGTHHIRPPDGRGVLIVTNHSSSGQIPPHPRTPQSYLDNSRARCERLGAIMQAVPESERTVALARRILADHEGQITVCQHVPDGFHTIAGYVLTPAGGKPRMHFCWGYPCQGSFVTYDF